MNDLLIDMQYLLFKIVIIAALITTLRYAFGDVSAGWFILFWMMFSTRFGE